MKKFVVLLLLLVALLGIAVVPALAQDNLTSLAKYFPDDAPLFMAVDISDGTLEKLDTVLAKIRELVPEAGIPPVTLTAMLDQAIQDEFKADFQTVIRSWLGDTAAVGFMNLDMQSSDAPLVAAVAITDRAKATAFASKVFAAQIENGSYTQEETSSYTLFVPAKDSYQTTIVAINDEALFITENLEYLGTPAAPLSANPTFTDTLALLPADSYQIQVYLDYGALMTTFMTQMDSSGMAAQLPPMLTGLYDAIGAQAYGLTLMDNRAFVMDVAQTYNDLSSFTEAGVVMSDVSSPINLDFARYLPADTQGAIFSTNFGPAMLLMFQNFQVVGDMLQEQMQLLPDSAFNNDGAAFLRNFNLGNIPTFINLAFSGTTGLNLEKDVLSWMTGNYANYFRLLPNTDGQFPITPDLVMVMEATDPDAASTLVQAVSGAADQYKLDYQMESIGGGDVLALNAPFMAAMPANGNVDTVVRELAANIDLLLGSNGDVLAAGTRPGVTYSLDPQGVTLLDTPLFTEAQVYALAESQALGYLNLRAFVPLVDFLAGLPIMSDRDVRDLNDVRMVLGLFNSASFSAAQRGDNASVGRFVLTLGGEPLPPAQ